MALKLVDPNNAADTDTPSISTGSGHPVDTVMEGVPPSDSTPGEIVDEERTYRTESEISN